MKKIAFIGNLYHQKTSSSVFFQEILKKYFLLDCYYGLPRNNLKEIDFKRVNTNNYEIIIFWQVIPNIVIINKFFKNKNLVFIPMYDNTIGYEKEFWLKLKQYKFINFSKILHDEIENMGINSLYIQYAPKIQYDLKKLIMRKKKVKIFFWQRRKEITWNLVKRLLILSQVESIHIHTAVDPNMEFVKPSIEDIQKFNITFSTWFDTKEDYLKKMQECDVYIAPRPYEGIGMSFIEAMSYGKAVIAPDLPTMNEYIKDKYNGYLYDINTPQAIDLSKSHLVGKNAYNTIQDIYKKWKDSEDKIINFILENSKKDSKMNKLLNSIENVTKISFFKNPIKKIHTYKKMLLRYNNIKDNLVQEKTEGVLKKQEKLLIVFPHNPFLLQNGVQSRFYGLLEYFNDRKIEVDILSHKNFVDEWSDNHLNHKLVNKVYLNDFKKSKLEQKINAHNSVLPDFSFSSLKKQLNKLIIANEYDAILMSYVHWAEVVKDIPNIKKYITIEDFISINNYERNKGKYNIGQSINEEIKRIELFDKAICISKDEMNFFERVCTDVDFYHIPHFLEDNFQTNTKKSIDIVFVGSDNPFNKDGMIWFLEKVIPLLSSNYVIKIIGKVNKHLETYKNKYQNIEFIDYIDDLGDIYKQSKITICPLQAGTGLKIKVIESLSFGVPVVTTKYGLVGMDSKYNGCLLADEPLEFAKSIELILQNKEIYKKYENEAKEYFIENFSKEKVYKKLDKVFFE